LQVRVAEGAVELKRRAQAEKEDGKQQMPVVEHSMVDGFENEEEVFAVLCIYSQLFCVGMLWWWQIY
jgi:hypothetical protein